MTASQKVLMIFQRVVALLYSRKFQKKILSSTILKESTTSTSTSTSTATATINQNNNIAPSEDSYISTSSEDDSSNSHVDESSLYDSDIELENCFYTNTDIE